MGSFQAKYGIYGRIYRRTKDTLNGDKCELGAIKSLNVKNAVFLNEAHIQCNNRSRRLEIEKVMGKFGLYV